MTIINQKPRFIADAMLGRLARWLRFLGFDTLYYPDISDRMLLKIAREQDRFILTRDTRLIKSKSIKDYLLINANDIFKQLQEVIKGLQLKDFDLFSRCVKCNGKLTKISSKSEVKNLVPEFVFIQYKNFLKCNDCGKIYWKGTHPKKFKENLIYLMKED